MNLIEHLVEREFKTTKDMVEFFLETDSRCRRDDLWLTYRVFNYILSRKNKKMFLPFEMFSELPQFETVKRCRALIQNKEGKFLPPDDVYQKRIAKRRKLDNINGWL